MSLARALEPLLVPSVPPVIVLEGARTVGKTVVAHRLVEAGHYDGYENLADPSTQQIARADLAGWVESLPERVVIDEAQLVGDLPLHVKFLVDQPGSRRRFLLTGSAAIGRSGLGGSDPLTGRATRRRLWPLTAAEQAGAPERTSALIGALFSGDIALRREYDGLDIELVLDTGGFAPLALTGAGRAAADRWVRDTTIGLLTDHVLPDERFDAGIAARILDGCLRDPGGILNATALGQRVEVDPRTVDRYLDVLERRFLLHFLPNLAQNPARQSRSRAKVHAVDTAFVMESVRRADPAQATDPQFAGRALETWVAAQVLPCLELSDSVVSAYYWRDVRVGKNKPAESRSNEVDLVLVRGDGRTVGIEVKRSTRVSVDDAGGLLALRKARGLDVGYVLYSGTRTVRLAENVYALPLGALA